MKSKILDFYSGSGTDERGRSLNEILEWTDEQLESIHNFIQWLFPLKDRSLYNSEAPVLDEATIAEFRARPELQDNLRRAYQRMLRFYEWKENWLSPGNHNHLRITRMIRCMRLLGLEEEAQSFYKKLAGIYAQERSKITPVTFRFWTAAAQDPL